MYVTNKQGGRNLLCSTFILIYQITYIKQRLRLENSTIQGGIKSFQFKTFVSPNPVRRHLKLEYLEYAFLKFDFRLYFLSRIFGLHKGIQKPRTLGGISPVSLK